MFPTYVNNIQYKYIIIFIKPDMNDRSFKTIIAECLQYYNDACYALVNNQNNTMSDKIV